MSLTAIGVGMAALAVIGGGLGIGFATSSAVKAIAQQPEAHGKIRSTLLIGAALAEATAIYGFVLGRQLLVIFIHLYKKTSRCAVTTGILYDSFNACTILLTLSM